MPTARNMQELERMLRSEMESAMREISAQALKDMQTEVLKYYMTETPVMYKRTGHLMRSPRVSPLHGGGRSISFDAYLDTNYTYPHITYTYTNGNHTTSKAPTMLDVLKLTNNGDHNSSVGYLHSAIGSPGYWQEAEERMTMTIANIMRRHFP